MVEKNQTALVKDLSWTNKGNARFYKEFPLKDFNEAARMAGLDTCCDVQLIEKRIGPSDVILEIGAGYGRVLNYLKNHGYCHLFAIERDHSLYHLLKAELGETVTLFNADLNEFDTPHRFHTILWLWSGIMDFSKKEQPKMLKKLNKWLKPKGKIIIDAVPTPLQPSEHHIGMDDQSCLFEYKGNQIWVYCPSIAEMKRYCNDISLQYEHMDYKTSTGHSRIMHILSRKD